MKKISVTIISIFLFALDIISQTQYDYYGHRGFEGGVIRALNGMIIMIILIVIAIAILFIIGIAQMVYFKVNPSADPDIQRYKQLQEIEIKKKASLEIKRSKAVPLAIELGLSVKWASFNLGAYCSTDIGLIMTWGNNSSENPAKINDVNEIGEYTGNKNYDAATYKLGSGWRIPTEKECEELITKCKWQYHEKDTVKGYLITGPSGNSIFLPYNQSDKTDGPYTYAAYWTSSPSYSRYGAGHDAKYLRLSVKNNPTITVWDNANATSCHFGIRPVFGVAPNKIENITIDDKETSDLENIPNHDAYFDELIQLSKIQRSDIHPLIGPKNNSIIIDEFNVVYSKDGKRLIDAGNCNVKEYHIKKGTEIICEYAFTPKGINNIYHYDSTCRIIEIPSSVKYIGHNALQCNCDYKNWSPFYDIQGPLLIDLRTRSIVKCLDTHITKIVIGNGILSVEADAFLNCRELKEVELPSTLLRIKESAFMGCEKLKSINLPQELNTIEDSTFYGCCSLNGIHLADNIYSIEQCAFSECKSLEIKNLPIRLESIGKSAFSKCKSITGILPNSLKTIGDAPFPNTNVKLTSDSLRYKIIDGLLIDILKKEIIQITDEQLKNIDIPNDILSINNFSFSNSRIENINIHNPETKLGIGVFCGCKDLTHVDLPKNLKEIPSNTFSFCVSIESLSLPINVENICAHSFFHCKKLTNIILGNKVKRIEKAAFESCESLISIEIPFSVEYIDNAFERSGIEILNFNACNAEIHFSTKSFSQINIGDMVTILPKGLFSEVNIKKINIPANVKFIKEDCFKDTIADELFIESTDIKFDNKWISKSASIKKIYIRVELFNDIVHHMPTKSKIKKIYPHKFLFFKWR